jgi:APA family basic amino acid/polyamine antiporter
MMLRRRDPNRQRRFRVPMLWLVGPATIIGCLFLFLNLPTEAMLVLPIWTVIGFAIYFGYSYRSSHLGRGLVEVHEPEIHDIDPDIPGLDTRDPLDPPRRPPGI